MLGRRSLVSVAACLTAVAGVACAADDGTEADDAGLSSQPEVTASAPPPLPWSTVSAAATARQGEYHEVTRAAFAGREFVLVEEWVAFDLDRAMFDRRVVVRYDSATGEVLDEATRDDPSLQFIHADARVYMRHPQNLVDCGTAWAEMPSEFTASEGGLAIEGDALLTTELIDLLQSVGDPAPPTHNDEEATTFVVPAPGTTGIQLSTLLVDPELADRLTAMDQTAQVRVPHDGGPVEVIVDITDAMLAADPRLGERAGNGYSTTMRWTLTAPADVAIEVPVDVASLGSCT